MVTKTPIKAPPRYVRPPGWTERNEARWRAVLARVLEIEGGHSDDPVDRGGETHHGISLRFLKAAGRLDANRDGFADLDLNFDTVLDGHDIRALTPEIAGEVYLRHFYVEPGFWTLPQPFDGAMFDQAVNGGTTAAIRLLQRAINGVSPVVIVDGVLGPATRTALINAVNSASSYQVLMRLRFQAQRRYEQIVAADPTQRRFLKGWQRRARELGLQDA